MALYTSDCTPYERGDAPPGYEPPPEYEPPPSQNQTPSSMHSLDEGADSTTSDSKCCKKDRIGIQIGCSILLLVWYSAIGLFIWRGIDLLLIRSEYQQEGTEEQCLLVNYEVFECDYECDCTTDSDIGGGECSTCYGTRYEYDAIIAEKCGNETLFRNTDSWCPEELRDIAVEYTCRALDCDEGEFMFMDAEIDYHLWSGIVIIGAATLFGIYPMYLIVRGKGCIGSIFCEK